MKGLTYENLVIGTYILMVIIGIETGFLVGLVQRAGSIRKLFKLTSKDFHNDDSHPAEHKGKTAENPQVQKQRVESTHRGGLV